MTLGENTIEAVAGGRANRQEPRALRTCRWIFYCLVSTLSEFDLRRMPGNFSSSTPRCEGVVVSHDDRYPYIRETIASAGFRRLILGLHVANAAF